MKLVRISVSAFSAIAALAMLSGCGKPQNAPQSRDLTNANVSYDYSRLERGTGDGFNDAAKLQGKAFVQTFVNTELDAVYQKSKELAAQAKLVAAGTANADTLPPIRLALSKALKPVLVSATKQLAAKVPALADTEDIVISMTDKGLLFVYTKGAGANLKVLGAVLVEYKIKNVNGKDVVTDHVAAGIDPGN